MLVKQTNPVTAREFAPLFSIYNTITILSLPLCYHYHSGNGYHDGNGNIVKQTNPVTAGEFAPPPLFFLYLQPLVPPTSNVYLDLARHIPPAEIKY